MLNEEQKTQLLLAAKAGNSEARAQMIQGNLRLVLSVVQKFAGRGENLDDLFQVGCIGLIKAINTFNPVKNIKLATYASRCIENEILMYFRSMKKTAGDVSLSDCIETGRDGNALSLMDVLCSDEDLFEDLSARQTYKNFMT